MDLGYYISTHPQVVVMIIWPIAIISLLLVICQYCNIKKAQLRHAHNFNHNCEIIEAMGENAVSIQQIGLYTTFDKIFDAPKINLSLDDLNKPCSKCDQLFKDAHEIFFDLKENRFRILAKDNMVCF